MEVAVEKSGGVLDDARKNTINTSVLSGSLCIDFLRPIDLTIMETSLKILFF